MGHIIGEGITFDDVLLVPSYSQVIPNQVDLTTWLTKKNQASHSYDECGNGHSYRTQNGNCYGKAGRYWYHSQKYVD